MSEFNLPGEPEPQAAVMARPIGALPYSPGPQHPLRLDLGDLTRRDAALDLTLILLVAIVIPFGLELAAAGMVDEQPTFDLGRLLIVRKWFDAALLVGLAGYLLLRHRLPPAGLGLRTDGIGQQSLWALATWLGVCVVFYGSVLVIAPLVLLHPSLEQDVLNRTRFLELLPIRTLRDTVLLLIPVAIHEELLFRGLFIPYLRRIGCSWTAAILIPTTIFALFHLTQGWLAVVQIFGVGAVLGVFFVLSRSVPAVVAAHFLFDFLQVQLAHWVLPRVQQLAPQAG